MTTQRMIIRSNGSPYPATRQPAGSIQNAAGGYLRVYVPDHPLASAQGLVQVHRLVLADEIGLDYAICPYCGRTVDWFGKGSHRLVVDHLDDNKINNSPENLVPSCTSCNAHRVLRPHVVEKNYEDNDGGWWLDDE
jgi:hypothetical protein